jgi:hypothetical protein
MFLKNGRAYLWMLTGLVGLFAAAPAEALTCGPGTHYCRYNRRTICCPNRGAAAPAPKPVHACRPPICKKPGFPLWDSPRFRP